MNRRTLARIGVLATQTLLVLVIIVALTFMVFSAWPADPALLACGRPCTPDRLESARVFLGYDQPWYTQVWNYLTGIVAGRTFGEGAGAIHCDAPCLGYSFRLGAPVTSLIASRAPVTASLAIGAAVLWLLGGVLAGMVSALRRGTFADRGIMALTVVGVSAPSYLLGLLGILVFGFTLDMVPVANYVPFSTSPIDWAWHLVLPWTVLAFINAAVYARLVRGHMLENLGLDYVRMARSLGLTERTVISRQVLPNVLTPVIPLVALDLGALLGGAVITERVFSMPGVGSLLMDAVGQTDLPVIVGVTVFAAAIVILANLVADILATVLDPRI
ncbi:ABC transporter permease [Propioniciclava soli]|uniref:ABC transporter permease n=1 Tax=Propioniciclava soli TaxID=2775081 RepID=A0ABZ3C7P0_9ACTN|nr:ABC transporter permease [Propioniciclava soli]